MENYNEISNTDLSKSQAILLYILQKTGGNFGHIKMMKTILLADQEIFRASYQSFSSYQYHKNEFGPYSESFQRDLDVLVNKEFITANPKKEIHPKNTYSFPLDGELNTNIFFSPNDKEILDGAIGAIEPMSAEEASESTHDRVYDSLNEGDNIPLYAYLEPYKPSKEELKKAQELFNAN